MPNFDVGAMEEKDELLAIVAEHWMKTRIDAPLAAIDRLDQNAKQMIALCGVLQGALTAVVKIAEIDNPVLLSFATISFVFLFLSIYYSAKAVQAQVKYLGTSSVLKLLKASREAMMLTELAIQVQKMCIKVDATLDRKSHLITLGMRWFTLSMAGGLSCLLYTIWLNL
jgi:hypothetical protein